jgi:hypothetical protein
MVQGISPESYSSVSMADWPLVFSISWAGTLAATEELQVVTVGFDVLGDGAVIGAVEVTVEIPPS